MAGGLIQAVTAPVAMLVDAVTFAVSAVLIGRVRVPDLPVDTTNEAGLLRRARDGMGLVLKDRYLRASLACATTINLFNLMAGALLILFASRELGLSAGVIGLALGIGATGGLLGTVLAGPLARRIGLGRTIAVGAVVFSAPFALLPLAGGPTWSRAGVLALVEFISALGVMCLDIPLNALMTAVTPDGVRSRVSGLPGRPGIRVDIAYSPERLALEVDSALWHSDGESYRRDRAKWNLLAALGWTLLILTDFDLHERPEIVALDVLGALDRLSQGGVMDTFRPVRPRITKWSR